MLKISTSRWAQNWIKTFECYTNYIKKSPTEVGTRRCLSADVKASTLTTWL